MPQPAALFAFDGSQRIATGSVADVAWKVSTYLQANPLAQPLVFNAESGKQVDLDLRGTPDDARNRASVAKEGAPMPKAGKGRPKLGVTAREVTLLPRHWDWLTRQPGGASTTLRQLIDSASTNPDSKEQQQARATAAYHFMHAVAGNLPGFEAASRALFAGNREDLWLQIARWPGDIEEQVLALMDGKVQAGQA
jgi:uncharacterized protein